MQQQLPHRQCQPGRRATRTGSALERRDVVRLGAGQVRLYQLVERRQVIAAVVAPPAPCSYSSDDRRCAGTARATTPLLGESKSYSRIWLLRLQVLVNGMLQNTHGMQGACMERL